MGPAALALAAAWLAGGCGGQSTPKESASTATGGSSATSVSTTRVNVGGTSSAQGGNPATGGTPAAIGNSNSIVATSMGGKSAAGGGQSETTATIAKGGSSTLVAAGGGKSLGGNSATGGEMNGGSTAGGQNSGAGTTAASGAHIAGRASGGSNAFAGSGNGSGKSTGGAASSAGATSGGISPGGSSALNAFCQGSEAKVEYNGEPLLTPATSYESGIVMDCCNAVGINLHALGQLDFDFAVETIWSAGGGWTVGLYNVDDSQMRLRGVVRRSSDAAGTLSNGRVVGWGELLTTMTQSEPWYFRFCFEVSDPNSPLHGTRLYVPNVGMLTGYKYRSRFELYLLKDESLTPLQAKEIGPPWPIADRPILDLGAVAYVSQSTSEVGLTPGVRSGQTFVSQVGGSNTVVRPFVVVADGVQIYLGTVGTMASAAAANAPVGPVIYLPRVGDNGFTIEEPMGGTDPRNDARIWTALGETAKLIP